MEVSSSTLKFYKSDFMHFCAWLLLKVRAWGILTDKLEEAVAFLSPKVALEYRHYLVSNETSDKTTNRRLSTLRNLARFLVAADYLHTDFMQGVSNISQIKVVEPTPVIDEFRKHLAAQKVSENTIRNYVSDINQFIEWSKKHAQPA